MDRGRLVELGNHDELMAAEGHYYKLYQAQARNVDTEPELQRSAEPVSKELGK
jgi:ATP-binding cassette subfamily B protein